MDDVFLKLSEIQERSGAFIALYYGSDCLRFANRAFREAYFIEPDETPLWADLMRRNFDAARGTVIRTHAFEEWLVTTQSRRGQQVVLLLLNLIYLPLQLTCVTLLYFDIRVRTEGFDLAVLALSDRVDSETVRVTAPPLEKNTLPHWEEIGYFSLITVAIAVLYIALLLIFVVAALGFSGF